MTLLLASTSLPFGELAQQLFDTRLKIPHPLLRTTQGQQDLSINRRQHLAGAGAEIAQPADWIMRLIQRRHDAAGKLVVGDVLCAARRVIGQGLCEIAFAGHTLGEDGGVDQGNVCPLAKLRAHRMRGVAYHHHVLMVPCFQAYIGIFGNCDLRFGGAGFKTPRAIKINCKELICNMDHCL